MRVHNLMKDLVVQKVDELFADPAELKGLDLEIASPPTTWSRAGVSLTTKVVSSRRKSNVWPTLPGWQRKRCTR